MAANNAEVSSEALTGLQTDLTQLSNSLHEIFDLMNADMSQVGEAWRDGKYEEFVNGYRPQINKCEEISVRYHDWCTRILSPAIERVVEVEQSNVGGDGSGTAVSSGSAAAGAGASGAIVSSLNNGKATGFNMGDKSSATSQSTPSKGRPNVLSRETGEPIRRDGKVDPALATEKQASDAADAMCARNPNAVGKIKVENTYEGSDWNLGGKGKVKASGLAKGFIDAEVEGNGEYRSGKTTSKVTIEEDVDCSKRS